MGDNADRCALDGALQHQANILVLISLLISLPYNTYASIAVPASRQQAGTATCIQSQSNLPWEIRHGPFLLLAV